MKKNATRRSAIKFSVLSGVIIAGLALGINACNKANRQTPANQPAALVDNQKPAPVVQDNSISQVVTVANMRKSGDGSHTVVYFHENAEIFKLTDAAVIAQLQKAFDAQTAVKITFNPWTATVLNVTDATAAERTAVNTRQLTRAQGYYQRVNLATADPEVINNPPAMAVLNTSSSSGLDNVIPDMATAQMMFNYITHQCCANPGPYQIDHCIPFQYVIDGCYARAHKMCWIINNTYHYDTHKIFSFAVGGSYSLSVMAEKWGGCCVNWWYHVAPLVNIKTTTGVKAYVFDPGMFDQPVPLTTWLHAQANPSCVSGADTARVTSYNIQPTSSYSPYDTSTFDTDPYYSSTNSTLMSYAHLHTCH